MQDFPSRLQAILDAENLTVYGACMVIGAETDEPTKTIHARLMRWLRKTPKTLREVEIALNSLGYEIKIEKSKPSEVIEKECPQAGMRCELLAKKALPLIR